MITAIVSKSIYHEKNDKVVPVLILALALSSAPARCGEVTPAEKPPSFEDSNSIWAYNINAAGGRLTANGSISTGAYPVAIAVDPAGQFVYGANYGSNTI